MDEPDAEGGYHSLSVKREGMKAMSLQNAVAERVKAHKLLSALIASTIAIGVIAVLIHAGLYFQRSALFDELRPVSLKNCQFSRFGGRNDGGYLLCENLLSEAKSAYSYGIKGEDNWGCDVSAKYKLPIHQYDCFDTTRPVCAGAGVRFRFNEECIGSTRQDIDGKPFDTLTSQIFRNGDQNRKLVVKMDVEGAEWDSLLHTPDATLRDIDQLVVEFHYVRYGLSDKLLLIRRLKTLFYIVNVHFNNFACRDRLSRLVPLSPFPSWAFQVVFVSKRLGTLDPETKKEAFRNPLESPDNPDAPDCQANW